MNRLISLGCIRHRLAFLLLGPILGIHLLQAQSNYEAPYTFTTFAGLPPGTIGSAVFHNPQGVALDREGNLYVADSGNNTIRKVSPSGVVTTIAGTAGQSGSADGTGSAARFNNPIGIAVDRAGNIYVADTNNSTIRKITAAGAVTTLAGVAGQLGSADGTGIAARFSNPFGIAVDQSGDLYVADVGNSTIRKISPSGEVSTFAGTPGQAGSVDGSGSNAQFAAPRGITVDNAGNVYVVDSLAGTIRRITPGGVVSTLAGTAFQKGSVDGTGTAAQFSTPEGVAVDSYGNIYVADTNNDTIREVAMGGVVTTLAGKTGQAGGTDGLGDSARFSGPTGIAVDAGGALYVADTTNSTIRKGLLLTSSPQIQLQPSNQAPAPGQSVSIGIKAASTSPLSYQWGLNGAAISDANATSLALANVQPLDTGLYSVLISTASGSVTSSPAIIGISTTSPVVGSGSVVGTDIVHPNGNHFDQILVTGVAESITTQGGRITRTSFIDMNDDIVQVEFAGAGTLSLVLAGPSGPAAPLLYNQPSVSYMKGHAGIVIVGANETTNLSVFTVGRATAFDPTGTYNILQPPSATNVPADNGSLLFQGHEQTAYDGVADIAFVAIASTDGKFGGLRAANARFWATQGLTGIYAPGIAFQGPVFIGNIDAYDVAAPAIILGSTGDARITGGNLLQSNSSPVQVSGLTELQFTAGSDSSGNIMPAQVNQGVLMDAGEDVTAQIVVNP